MFKEFLDSFNWNLPCIDCDSSRCYEPDPWDENYSPCNHCSWNTDEQIAAHFAETMLKQYKYNGFNANVFIGLYLFFLRKERAENNSILF